MNRPIVQGWCPGARRPMLSGDGWVLRVRPRLGRFSTREAGGVAALAARFGNGWLDVSSRANLQIRGVREEAIAPLTEGLEALGLLDPDGATETRRNLMTTPFHCDGDESALVATDLARLLAEPDAPDLPAKFGFSIDCGARPVLAADPADIRIERGEGGALLCRADGATTGARVTVETAAQAAIALARWFLESGGAPFGRGRMAAHLSAGAEPPAAFGAVQSVAQEFSSRPGSTSAGVMVALAFGQIRAETLAALAERGPIRMTPWRMMILEGQAVAPALEELIVDPDDALLQVVACTGAPGCLQAHQPTRALARALAPVWGEALAGHVPGLLHVTGCAKGCAHPFAARATLVGAPEGFSLIRDGAPGLAPLRVGLAPDPAVLSSALTSALTSVDPRFTP